MAQNAGGRAGTSRMGKGVGRRTGEGRRAADGREGRGYEGRSRRREDGEMDEVRGRAMDFDAADGEGGGVGGGAEERPLLR